MTPTPASLKKKKEKKVGFSIALSKEDIDIVDSSFEGKNFSIKLHAMIKQFSEVCGIVVRWEDDKAIPIVPGAICIFHEDPSERWWHRPLLPDCKQGAGIYMAEKTYKQAGWMTQIIDRPEEGFRELWVAPKAKGRDCQDCRRKIMEVFESC